MNGIRVTPLLESDAAAVPGLTETGVRKEVFPLTIYSSPMYSEFIKHSMLNSPEAKFFGAYRGDQLLGFAEWRAKKEELFLNNIAVQRDERGLGIGSLLYHHGLATLRKPIMKSVALDVFDDNETAKAWYEQMGYEVEGSTYWQVGSQTDMALRENVHYSIKNLEEADNHHKRYGFSMLTIETKKGEHAIGRITNKYFRCNPKALIDIDLLCALQDMDPERHLLVIDKQPVIEGLEKVCTSLRMRVSLSKHIGGQYDYQTTGFK